MTDRLQQMLDMQRELQRRINGYDIEEQSTETRIANIMLNTFCVGNELHEMMDEMGWKPWATSRHLNHEMAKKELVDVWHFLMNIMLHLGMDGDELYRLYRAKNVVNHARQDNGYDGVTNKCPNCHRDLDEVKFKEVHAQSSARIDLHCECGAYVRSLNA